MNTYPWISRFAATLAFVSAFGGVVLPPLCAQEAVSCASKKAKIFVIRGGGGYFPNLGTVINQKFEQQGLDVVDYRYHERSAAAQQIAREYRAKQLPHGVIMIGYSLGGCGVMNVAKSLEAQQIPVRLLFLIETINPAQKVPANVEECFNLYHFPAILGSAVRAKSKTTKLVNFEAYSDGKLGLEYSHFTMPFVEEVHEIIAKKLIEAIETTPSRKVADSRATPTPLLVPTSGKSPAPSWPASSRMSQPRFSLRPPR